MVVYSERFFDLQLSFARRIAAIASLPFSEAVLRFTAVFTILGLGSDVDSGHLVWQSYVQGLGDEKRDATWTYHVYCERRHQIPKFTDRPHWGCFAYHYIPDRQVVGLHFSNQDTSDLSPLSVERRAARIAELREMFVHIQSAYPPATGVVGGSWLYNWEAYRRLFPAVYQQSVYPAPPRFQFRSLWGQFLQRDGELREEPAAYFLRRVGSLCDVSNAATCFPYQVLGAHGDLREFIAFYNIYVCTPLAVPMSLHGRCPYTSSLGIMLAHPCCFS